MNRLLHWQYSVPRVLGVIVLLMAVQYIFGLAARSVAVHSAEATFGTRLDLEHARVSLVDQQVVFSGLHLANPCRPNENIFEAESCELKLATEPLLHKRVVIESGRISGLRFELPDGCRLDLTQQDANLPRSIAWLNDRTDVAASKWLDRVNDHFTPDAARRFESVRRAESFYADWSRQSAKFDSRLHELDVRAAELQEAVEAAQANPLRNDKLVGELRPKVLTLQKEFIELKVEVERLPDLLESNRRAIVAARQHDEALVGNQLCLEPADVNALSAYLLRERAAQQVNQLVDWLRCMRGMAPRDSKSPSSTSRGFDVQFAGCRQEPGVLIRSLQLDGAGRIGGQPVQLRGLLTNFTSEPRKHAEPIKLHLVGNGSMPFELQAKIDRTGSTSRDELLVDCQGIIFPEVALGHADRLEMKVGPSSGMLTMSLVADGDKLTGDIQLVQRNVQLTPLLCGAGGPALSAAMRDTLGQMNSVATRLSLGGTIQEPTCALWSNLGAAVAETFKRGIQRAENQHQRMIIVEAGRRVDERLAEIDREMSEKQSRFANRTTEISARLGKIAAGETPRYRISDEQGGRRLPKNSLFR
jgi:uncharacterized protein (TIGR03545 family)